MTSAEAAHRATLLLDMGRPDDALQVVAVALAQEPSSWRLLCLKARAHLGRGEAQAALEAANSAVGLAPDEEWGHRLASLACSALGRSQEAVRAAAEAVRLAPHTWQTHQRLSGALSNAGRHEEAQRAAEEAVRLAPDQPEAHFAIGYAAMGAKRRRQARAAFQRVLTLDPENSAAMNNLAKLRLERFRLISAARALGSSLGADPHSKVAQYNVDVVARRLLWVFHVLTLLVFVIVGAALDSQALPNGSSHAPRWVVGLSALLVVGFVAAVVGLDRVLPRSLRLHYRRLPFSDRYFGGWLGLDLVAFGLILALPLVPVGDRGPMRNLAFYAVLAGALVGRVGSSQLKKRLARIRSGA